MSGTIPTSWVRLSVRTAQRGPFLDPDGYCYLAPIAANSFEALSAAYKAVFGTPIPVAEAGRSGDRQNYLHTLYVKFGGSLALPEGQSVHESGRAVDFAGRAVILGTQENDWLQKHGPAFGWIWTGKNFKPVPEKWHYEQNGTVVAALNSTPITEREDDMRIIWTQTGGHRQTAWFVGPGGVHGIPTPRLRGLLARVIADVTESDNFLDAEIAEMSPYLTPAASAVDVAGITASVTKAVTDAVKASGVTVDAATVAAAVDKGLADNFAAIPAGVLTALKAAL